MSGGSKLALALAGVAALGMPLTMIVLTPVLHPLNGCAATTATQPATSTAARNSIPANYLKLYRAAGAAYGIPWNVLAGIGKIETNHGRLKAPGVTSGSNPWGAAGPMQFGIGGKAGNTWGAAPRHPARQHVGKGVDGDHDGWADVYDPADAIPAAAGYLKQSGAPQHLRKAIFAYNHSDAYVDHVLAAAKQYAAGGYTLTADNTLGITCTPATGTVTAPNQIAAKVIAYAKAQLGKPYIYGGTGPRGYDCSGLTMMAYRSAGVNIPRLSDSQYWYGPHIPDGKEAPGDLVYFDYKPGHSGPGHVGIVYDTKKGTMLVAPHTGAQLRVQDYRHYPGGYVGFTRPYARGASK